MQDLESRRTSLDERTLTGTAAPSEAEVKTAPATDDGSEPANDQIETRDEEKAVPSTDEDLYPVTDLDKGIVGWDSQDDPANPQNFAESRKWVLLGLISLITIVSPLASSMFAPAVQDAAKELNVTNTTLLEFSVTIYLLGYTVSLVFPLHSKGELVSNG